MASLGVSVKSLRLLKSEYEKLSKEKPFVQLNQEHGKKIADAYENMKHEPNHPEVKASYDALINETKDQYKNLLNQGYKFTRITDPNFQPYKNSQEMHNILFSGQHPSKLIHEAFLQHMRDKGKSGSWFHIWQAEPKAELANQDMSKDLPVHMKVGYDEVPIKMGYEAATYGGIKPQTDKDLHGAPTWQAPLRKSLKTLIAEYEKLQKVRFENNTHYPEMKDALNNTLHPIKPHLVAFVARNGQPVWRYNDKVSAEEDSRLRSLAAGGLGNKISKLSGMNQRHVRELVTNLLQNPDRHAISANTDPSKPKDHVELRARHLSNALIGKDGYSIADHPEGIEIVAPRHSQSTQTKDYATSWVYNTQTKQLKSLRHYPKSVTG